MRIASYNIHHGMDVQMNMEILGRDVAETGADLAGLQEIDQFVKRSGNQDTLSLIAAAAGLPHKGFSRGIDLQGGEYGTALISRYPIRSFSVTMLESGTAEQRSLGHAVLDVDGKEIHFINTHLALGPAENRAPQFAQIAAELPADAPWIVTGDFNTQDFEEFAPLGGQLFNCADRRLESFYPSGVAIDNIVLSHHWTIAGGGMVEKKDSDHYMIWCDASL